MALNEASETAHQMCDFRDEEGSLRSHFMPARKGEMKVYKVTRIDINYVRK